MQAPQPIVPTPIAPQVDTPKQTDPASATDQFGLSFESLLKIVLTQLTYQDPLEPMENFEFVSQLAQFSQIQQTQAMNENLALLVQAQSASQGAALLGRTVDVAVAGGQITGRVISVSFTTVSPQVTIETAPGQTIGDVPIRNITRITETR